MCWLLRPFLKSSWLQSRKNNRKLDIWEPRWVSRDEFGLGLVVGFLEWSGLFTFYTCQDLMNMDIISPRPTPLLSHILIAVIPWYHDTTRGSRYDNTSPLETTKAELGAPEGGCVWLLYSIPDLSFSPAWQLLASAALTHGEVQLNHTETGIPFLNRVSLAIVIYSN